MRRRFFTKNKIKIKDLDKYKSEYLTIEALEDGLTVSLSENASEYCVDGGDWTNLAADTATQSVNSGQKIQFRINEPTISSLGIGTFTISKKCNVKGNIMSLLYGDDFEEQNDLSGKSYVFYWLFFYCVNIVDASELILPATTLASDCYSCMFEGCTNLTTAPALPATRLADFCYNGMFFGCTNLTTAPELPATTLADRCYGGMFYDCSNLNYIKMLATDISAWSCLYNWVTGVASTGTFVKHPDMDSLPTGNSGIPSGWAVEDAEINLITFRVIHEDYQGEEGMTWDQWLNSEYNTINAYESTHPGYIEANRFLEKLGNDGMTIISYRDGTPVLLDDIIINNHYYTYIPPPSTD